MRLLHISETSLGESQVSTDMLMAQTELKTPNVVNFV